MLKGVFFTIKESTDSENSRTCRVALNASHPIFQAHFAGYPIMPGACVVQLIKELASDYLGQSFFIYAVKNMKFLQVINPIETPELSVRLTFTKYIKDCVSGSTLQDENCISVSSILSDNEIIFSKSTIMLKNR